MRRETDRSYLFSWKEMLVEKYFLSTIIFSPDVWSPSITESLSQWPKVSRWLTSEDCKHNWNTVFYALFGFSVRVFPSAISMLGRKYFVIKNGVDEKLDYSAFHQGSLALTQANLSFAAGRAGAITFTSTEIANGVFAHRYILWGNDSFRWSVTTHLG